MASKEEGYYINVTFILRGFGLCWLAVGSILNVWHSRMLSYRCWEMLPWGESPRDVDLQKAKGETKDNMQYYYVPAGARLEGRENYLYRQSCKTCFF